MIAGIAGFQQVIWAANWGVAVFLLLLVTARKNYRFYPLFTFYVCLNTLLSALVFVFYLRCGVTFASWLFAWAAQGLAVCARALAVAEVFRHVLSRFVGIWALGKRLLVVCVAVVLSYSGLATRRQWQSAVPSADRGLELAVAVTIVVLLLFARYYNVPVASTDRTLAIGFCLYSCFFVLNNTVLERYLQEYGKLWSLMEQLAYLATLVLWSSALWEARIRGEQEQKLLSPGVYQSVTPQINLRLRELDEQLCSNWKVGVSRR